ncbi:hypothetical protein [Croceicoccus gelatinilyticus]|uniref:hypothetical protein n=1 Tax=Croceicoccus gelatinilyticus TaxID=2835536 RepID=UPI001BCC730F|nr:hypothetical protein [Croceicoccus gelatinilyticus]MBS7669124.1 hypothetical protein [Croceicoccus gelatinilyticus]
MGAPRGLAIIIIALALAGSPPALGQTITRAIPLEEIGFGDGVEFSGRDGKRALHFPIGDPADVESVVLTLPFETNTALPADRQVTLRVSGRAIATRRFADRETGVWRVPVPRSLLRDHYLVADLEYSGSRIDAQCVDSRIGGDWLHFGGRAEAQIVYHPSAIASPARALGHAPGPLVIELPKQASEAQVAGAILLSATRPARFGTAAAVGAWRETRVIFDGNAVEPLKVVEAARPAFVVGDPLAAPRLFANVADYRGGALPTVAAALGKAGAGNRAAIALGSLDADLTPRLVSDRGGGPSPSPLPASPRVGRSPGSLPISRSPTMGEKPLPSSRSR